MKSFFIMGVAAGLMAGIAGASAQTSVTAAPVVATTRAVAVTGFGTTLVEGVLPTVASGIKVIPGSILPAYVPLTYTVSAIPATGYVAFAPGIGHLEWMPTGTGFMRLGVRGWSSHVIMPAMASYSYFISPDRKMVFVNPLTRQVLRIVTL